MRSWVQSQPQTPVTTTIRRPRQGGGGTGAAVFLRSWVQSQPQEPTTISTTTRSHQPDPQTPRRTRRSRGCGHWMRLVETGSWLVTVAAAQPKGWEAFLSVSFFLLNNNTTYIFFHFFHCCAKSVWCILAQRRRRRRAGLRLVLWRFVADFLVLTWPAWLVPFLRQIRM